MPRSTIQSRLKDEIRKAALDRRNAIPAEERAASSARICSWVMDDDLFLNARGIHVYQPIGSEVDIRAIIDTAWEMGKDVGMMVVSEDGGSHQFAITAATQFQRSSLGILQPTDAEPFDMNLCDLVIVPAVAADEQCNRLGYGKGYYDQFLMSFPRPAIGVVFEAQIVPAVPIDEGDICLDGVYTEQRVIGVH